MSDDVIITQDALDQLLRAMREVSAVYSANWNMLDGVDGSRLDTAVHRIDRVIQSARVARAEAVQS